MRTSYPGLVSMEPIIEAELLLLVEPQQHRGEKNSDSTRRSAYVPLGCRYRLLNFNYGSACVEDLDLECGTQHGYCRGALSVSYNLGPSLVYYWRSGPFSSCGIYPFICISDYKGASRNSKDQVMMTVSFELRTRNCSAQLLPLPLPYRPISARGSTCRCRGGVDYTTTVFRIDSPRIDAKNFNSRGWSRTAILEVRSRH